MIGINLDIIIEAYTHSINRQSNAMNTQNTSFRILTNDDVNKIGWIGKLIRSGYGGISILCS